MSWFARGGVEPHRHVHEPERHGAVPDRAHHRPLSAGTVRGLLTVRRATSMPHRHHSSQSMTRRPRSRAVVGGPGHDGSVLPMLPVPGDLPVEGAWSYEVDWAGVRLLADVDEGVLTLCTADGEDVTARFPEFAGLVDAVADGLLDGEAVMLDGGSPSADALGERLGVERRHAAPARWPASGRRCSWSTTSCGSTACRSTPGPSRSGGRCSRASTCRGPPASRSRRPTTTVPPCSPASSTSALSGVIAKRRGTPYRSGDSGGDWVRVAPHARAAGREPTAGPSSRRPVPVRRTAVHPVPSHERPSPADTRGSAPGRRRSHAAATTRPVALERRRPPSRLLRRRFDAAPGRPTCTR